MIYCKKHISMVYFWHMEIKKRSEFILFRKLKPLMIIIIVFMAVLLTLPFKSITTYIKSALNSNKNYILEINTVSPNIKSVTCDPNNKVLMVVSVKDFMGKPIPRIKVDNKVENGVGELTPQYGVTNDDGDCLITYTPPKLTNKNVDKFKNNIPISAKISTSISKANMKKSLEIGIKRIPLIYIHGYQESKNVFNSMDNYLTKDGFESGFFSYDSNEGVENSASLFAKFLEESRAYYLDKGLKVQSFDIICHSMGGLVARYYTCSDDYWQYNDVNKLIFIATPHKGSHIASIGASIYDDYGIRDLQPDSKLLTDEIPKMFNKGLNSTIQTANILGQYDEVVTFDSASLDEWDIKTEVYNVGESNLSVDGILKGTFISALNHKNILSNTKVFNRIEEMLYKDLNYPTYVQ